jgi:hypothetical protein
MIKDCVQMFNPLNLDFIKKKARKHISNTKTSQLMLCKEIIEIYSENHTKHINTFCGQNTEYFNVKTSDKCIYHSILKIEVLWVKIM